MRLTKLKSVTNELQSEKKPKKTLTSNYLNKPKQQENKNLKRIIKENTNLKKVKERIKQESNMNITDILPSDEIQLKKIKYTMRNNNNDIAKLKPNLTSIQYDFPISISHTIKPKERTKKIFYKKLETISPIKKGENNSNKNQKDPELIDSPMNILFQRNRINFSNLNSQSGENIQFLTEKNRSLKKIRNNNTINNPSFYHKVKYIKKNNRNRRDRNPGSNLNLQDADINDEIHRNKTINNFYVHKQINKSGLFENNNIKNYKNQNQGINVFYSTKNINYDIMYNFPDNNSHNLHLKDVSQDDYYSYENHPRFNNNPNKTSIINKQKKIIQDSLYIPEVDNESDTNLDENNYNKFKNIKEGNKSRLVKKKKKQIIRIMNNNHQIHDKENDNDNNNISETKLKRKAESIIEREYPSNYLSKIKYSGNNEFIKSDILTQIMDNNTLDNNFSLHKKILTNFNNKELISHIDNASMNKTIFKKKAIKDNIYSNFENNNKKSEDKYKIYINDSFSIYSNVKNKIIFENEKDIIEYINNKFIKEKKYDINFTGYTFNKKYKGKVMFEIQLDNDINKFNKILKEENIKMENKLIEIIPINDKKNLELFKKNLISLENEMKKLKQENEALIKKDFLKNELIKKLDKEKQNIIEENQNLLNDIDKLKKNNENLNSQLNKYSSLIGGNKKNKDYKKENIIQINILNKQKNINNSLVKNSNDENKTPSSNEQSNNMSLNVNNAKMNIGINNQKNNAISIFRLSKISEINKVDNNIDFSEKEIKNNLDLLNTINNENNNDGSNLFINKNF